MAEITRDTLGGAVEVAGQLPDQVGLGLLDVARTAFVEGLHLVAGISAVLALAAAVLVAVLLRDEPAGSAEEAAARPDYAGFDLLARPTQTSET